MRISFLGAAGTVTGSMHLLEMRGRRVLLDCGLYQGRREEARRRNRELPFDPASLDGVVLSHAHVDHSGNLPTLARLGYRGDILCTAATRDLCGVMLRDSARIQEGDARQVTKLRARRGEPGVEPLYTVKDAEAALRLLAGVPYGRAVPLVPGVTLTFSDAGHILGAACVVLDVREEGGERFRFCFTGDLGRRGLPVIRDPERVEGIDWLVTESTYGDRLHGDLARTEEELREVVARTVARGGTVIIPAFAVGRTQEIVFALHRMADAGRIPPVPVFVDSPMALDATEVFRLHPEDFDEETNAHLRRDGDPFGFRRLTYIRSVEESKRLNGRTEPAVIISASGMLESGRVLHHLRRRIGDERTTVALVSWQAPDTLGRKLAEGAATVRIFGEEHQRRCEVVTLPGYSAHADRDDLLWWMSASKDTLKGVFVVHGEPPAAASLAEGIRALGVPRVDIPEPGSSVEVGA